MLPTRFPVKVVVSVVGGWLILTGALTLGVPQFVLDLSFGRNPQYQEMKARDLKAEALIKAGREIPDSDVEIKDLRDAGRIEHQAWVSRFWSNYRRVSFFVAFVFVVVLVGNWIIHRHDVDPFGWGKHDSP